MIKEYLPRIHVDAEGAIDLIVQHPEVGEIFDGKGQDRATFVTMPGKGFRVELKQTAERIARNAILRSAASAAAEVDGFLTLASQGQLPGYEVSVIRGLTVQGAVPVGSGAVLMTYRKAVERGLAKERKPEPFGSGPDHEADGASVLARAITWSPCLVRPRTSKHMGERLPKPEFAGNSNLNLGVVLDCLSLVTEQRVAPVEILSCAPRFTDIDPNFAPGTSTGWVINDQWPAKEFSGAQASRSLRRRNPDGIIQALDC